MELASTVTLTVGGSELTLDRLDPIWIDDSAHQIVFARLHPAMRPIPLWRGDAYDDIGDWTQAQAEAAVEAHLGEDQQEALQALVYAG